MEKTKEFDPLFIVYQIVAMQCFFYLSMGTLWGVLHAIFGFPVSMDHFFTPRYVNFHSPGGWLECFCILSCGVIG